MSADLQKRDISLPSDKHQLLEDDCSWVSYVQSLTASSIVLPEILTAGSAENQHVWHFMVSFCKAERNSPLHDAAELSLVPTYVKCLYTFRVQCFVTTPIWRVLSNLSCRGVKMQLECLRYIFIILVMRRNKWPKSAKGVWTRRLFKDGVQHGHTLLRELNI